MFALFVIMANKISITINYIFEDDLNQKLFLNYARVNNRKTNGVIGFVF